MNYTLTKFAFGIIFITFFSCRQNTRTSQMVAVKADSIIRPVTISGKIPKLVLLDTCPPPRKVIIPAKPGGFSLRKSDMGMQRMQSLPPAINKAGLFLPIQTYRTEQGLAQDGITCITEDKYGNLWIGTAGAGISRYDGKSFTNFSVLHGLTYNYVSALLCDRAGNIWICAGQGGITCYDGITFTHYNTLNGLASNLTNCLIEDHDGNIWIGTGKGLSKFNPRTKSFKNFTTDDGLSDNRILSITEDGNGNIWIGHLKGLSRLNTDDSSVSVYTGMKEKAVTSMIKDKNGNILLGCYDGLRYIKKEETTISPKKLI